ncbi:MAG: hypothetical protein QM695_16705 [Micropruina sp.]
MKATAAVQPAARHATWVDAAPFRAHVRHTIEAAAVPWPVVAVAADVSLASVHALLAGRAGRTQTTIAPLMAARLLRLDARALHAMRSLRVSGWLTGRRLRDLLTAGSDPVRLARWCQIDLNELILLVEGEPTTCTRLTEALALAAERLGQTGGGRSRIAA